MTGVLRPLTSIRIGDPPSCRTSCRGPGSRPAARHCLGLQRARIGHRADLPGARRAQRAGARVEGGACRVDVVDEGRALGRRTTRPSTSIRPAATRPPPRAPSWRGAGPPRRRHGPRAGRCGAPAPARAAARGRSPAARAATGAAGTGTSGPPPRAPGGARPPAAPPSARPARARRGTSARDERSRRRRHGPTAPRPARSAPPAGHGVHGAAARSAGSAARRSHGRARRHAAAQASRAAPRAAARRAGRRGDEREDLGQRTGAHTPTVAPVRHGDSARHCDNRPRLRRVADTSWTFEPGAIALALIVGAVVRAPVAGAHAGRGPRGAGMAPGLVPRRPPADRSSR